MNHGTTMLGAATAALLALTGTVNAGFVDVVLDRDAQNGGLDGILGPLFQPVDINGDLAPLTVTARSGVDHTNPFNLFAPGQPGMIWVDGNGLGVKNLFGGGSAGLSGTGGDQDEELIFSFDMLAVAGSLELGITDLDPGVGIGDQDDPALFVFLDNGSWVTLNETMFMSAFTYEGDSNDGTLDFGMIDALDPTAAVAGLFVRETNGHIQIDSIAYSTAPAPGAMALLGLAGLTARGRRRRI